MDVKILTNQIFLKKLINKTKEERYKLINQDRWENFKEVFGEDNFGFILAGDVQREIRTGEKTPVYLFGKDLEPYLASERGIGCKLFLASSLSPRESSFPLREEIKEVFEYFEQHKREGKIEHIVNSKKGTLSEDKISILELQSQGIKTPETYNFQDFSELQYFLKEKPGEYVVKHRFGQGGEGLFRVNNKNLYEIPKINLKDFIVQGYVEILNEKRLIFFEDELIGSRIIYDRHMPWEEKGKVGRKPITEKYSPTPDEISDSRQILNLFDAELGCIDWIEVNGKGRQYMEYNGVGTGLGLGNYAYNLNKAVAEKLRKRYLE